MNNNSKFSWKFWIFIGFLGIIILGGLYAAYLRLTTGLGPEITGLTDYYPWGLWITFDVLVGVALAGGAFVMATMIYILRLDKYKPLVRPAILTGLIGYIIVIIALVIDIGQPERFWHPILMWQPESVMFEVVWCVLLYTFVLALEFSPTFFERFSDFWAKGLKRLVIFFAIAGVILSTLHQSSLGGLFLLMPWATNELWYTNMLPLLFFISAIAGGLSMVMLESIISARAMKRKGESHLLPTVSLVIAGTIIVYLVIKLADVTARGVWGNLTGSVGTMFIIEIVLLVIPLLIFLIPRARRSSTGLLFGSLLVVGGVIANRWNVNLTARYVPVGALYTPTWIEWMVTISLVALGVLIYSFAVKWFPVFEKEEPVEEEKEEETVPTGKPAPIPPPE